MMTVHPSGITHRRLPRAFAAGAKAARKETTRCCDDLIRSVGSPSWPIGRGRGIAPNWNSWTEKRGAELRRTWNGRSPWPRRPAGGWSCRDHARSARVPQSPRPAGVDDWHHAAPRLMRVYDLLNEDAADGAKTICVRRLAAPLPGLSWADGSAYVTHVELVARRAGRKCRLRSGPIR